MSDVEEVKSRVDLVGLIGETVQLKKAGTSYKGLCPFHGEKTPSFIVSPERGSWHCFGCGEGGDALSFVMKREHADFPEALQMLATRVGVELSKRDAKDAKKKQRLFEANDQAAKYFQAALGHGAGKLAREYLVARGIEDETIENFRLGYAPDSFEALAKALKGKGFSDTELVEAGLASRGGRGLYARFRHRLMVPIADSSGAIRGFTGRILDDSVKQAKYLNTAETSLFHKGKLVFALDKAKSAIIEHEGAVLVEGQMDVLMAHQAGTPQVVATSGTAMTDDQLRQLSRLSTALTLALDADVAGRKAMMRIVELVADREVELKVADLDGAKDPDELIKRDPELWKSALKNAKPVVEYLLDEALAAQDRPYSRSAIAKILAAVLPALRFRSALDQDYYTEQLASALGVEKSSIRSELEQPKSSPVPTPATGIVVPPIPKRPEELVTERLIGLAITTDSLRGKLSELNPRIFPEPYRVLPPSVEKEYTEQTVAAEIREALSVCALAAAEYEPMTETERAAEFDRLLARLKLLWGKQHQPKLLAAIKHAEETGRTSERNRLMEEYTTLTKRIQHG